MSNIKERIRMALAITRKDVADALTNRSFLVGFLMPPFLSVLFTLIFINEYRNSGTKIVVYDPEHSAFVEALRDQPGIDLTEVASEEQVRAAIEDDAAGGLVIPLGFDAALANGDAPELTLYISRAEGNGTQQGIRSITETLVRKQAGQTLPAEIAVTELGEPTSQMIAGNLGIQHFFMITLVTLSIVSIGMNTVPNMMIEEKERHTLDVILVSPASSVEVVIGKALTGILFTTLNVAVLIGMNQGWVGQWPLTFALVLLGMALMVLAGLLLGTLFNRQVTMNMWGTVLVMLLLTPTWFVGRGPEFIRTIAHALPTYYLVHGLQQTVSGEATLANLGPDVLALSIATLLIFVVVVWTQSRQEAVL